MINVDTVLTRLEGVRPCAGGYVARCPAHHDRKASLSIRETQDGRVLFHCFAGCTYAQIIAALDLAGDALAPDGSRPADSASTREADAERRRRMIAAAHHIWLASIPIEKTPAEAYLRSRGISSFASDVLKFHPACPHPNGGVYPALAAAVGCWRPGSRIEFRGVHRIFLTPDGRKASVEPQKASLGPIAGAAVWLTNVNPVFSIGEGIETVLSVVTALAGNPKFVQYSFASAVSASGLRALEIPNEVQELVICADNDGPGHAAARALAQRAIREGKAARIALPPHGNDFNDALLDANV